MDIDNQIIEDYLNYGVVLIKGAINPFWLNKLAVGIDKNFNNPSKYKCVYEKKENREISEKENSEIDP